VLIAVPSGAGVALSILGGNTGSLVGVAISASLLPPAVNAVSSSLQFTLINYVIQKHLNFYQHEQKDFVNHSYRIVLLITNSESVNCVSDFVMIRTICFLTF